MKGKLGYIVLFVLVLSVSVIVHIPAAWVIDRFAPDNVEIASVSGTIWNGDAQQVTIQTSANMPTVSLGRVNWSFNSWRLLLGKVDYAIRFGQNSYIDLRGKGHVGMGFSGAYAKDMELSIPAQQVVKFIELPMPVEVAGHIDLTLHHWVHRQPLCAQGDADLRWSQAKINSMAGDLDLDSINATINCHEEAIKDNVAGEESSIDIVAKQTSAQFNSELSITIDDQYAYELDAWLKPSNSFPTQMQQGLDMMVVPDGQGRYPYKMKGKL